MCCSRWLCYGSSLSAPDGILEGRHDMVMSRLRKVLRVAVSTEKRILLFCVVVGICTGMFVWWDNYEPLTDEYTGRLFFTEESSCAAYVSSVVMDENLEVERLDVEQLVASDGGSGFIVIAAVHTGESVDYMSSRYELRPYDVAVGIWVGFVLTAVVIVFIFIVLALLWIDDKMKQQKRAEEWSALRAELEARGGA